MRLIKGNVERIVENEAKAARLKSDGFKDLSEPEVHEDGGAGAVDITSMNVTQLKALAKEKGLEGYSSLTKEELLEILKEVV